MTLKKHKCAIFTASGTIAFSTLDQGYYVDPTVFAYEVFKTIDGGTSYCTLQLNTTDTGIWLWIKTN